MKISATKFVIIFLISAFGFQFISNSLLGPEMRLFPANGDWFPGTQSPIAWEHTLSTILNPIKIVLVGPLAPIFKGPDGAPPVLVLYYLLSKIITLKKNKFQRS